MIQSYCVGLRDEDTVKFVEGYTHFTNSSVKLEASESYDEEDDQPKRAKKLRGLSESISVTLEQFYQNLGDLTNPRRYQPGFKRARRLAVYRRRKLRAQQKLREGKGFQAACIPGILPICILYFSNLSLMFGVLHDVIQDFSHVDEIFENINHCSLQK